MRRAVPRRRRNDPTRAKHSPKKETKPMSKKRLLRFQKGMSGNGKFSGKERGMNSGCVPGLASDVCLGSQGRRGSTRVPHQMWMSLLSSEVAPGDPKATAGGEGCQRTRSGC